MMFSSNHPASAPLFHFHSPQGPRFVGLISIPHSGEIIPPEFHPFLSGDTLAYKEDVDYQVHQLIDLKALQSQGLGILVSNIHRIAVDLNRTPSQCTLHWEFNTKGKKIRHSLPDEPQALELQARYYAPYYQVLKSSLEELQLTYQSQGQSQGSQPIPIPVVDLHSMPSRPTEYHLKINPGQKEERPDFCVSDLRGKSCTKQYINYIVQELRQLGYQALINDPYFGGYVTEYFHQFPTNAVQIEIKRGLYMDEEKKCLLPEKAQKLKNDLTRVLSGLFSRFSLNQK